MRHNKYREKIQKVVLEYIQTDATKVKTIVYQLEIFDLLGVKRNEKRKDLLIKIRDAASNPPLRYSDMLYMIKTYPNTINNSVYEQILAALYKYILENKD